MSAIGFIINLHCIPHFQLIESLSAELGEVALPPAIMQDIVGDKEGATGLTWL